MKKNAFILLTGALLLGLNYQAHAGWVYEPDVIGDQEIAFEDEVDLSQILGKIEQDDDSFSYRDEDLLPWGIDDSKQEELSSFVEEHAKEAYRDYEESFAFDAEEQDDEGQYPTMERVPSRSSSLVASRPKVVESKPKEIAQSEKPLPTKKEHGLAKKRAMKKKPQLGAKQPRVKQSQKSVVRKERKAPSRSRETVQKKKQGMKNKKGAVAKRQKRQRPSERLAQNEE